jgi:hypothetical protein
MHSRLDDVSSTAGCLRFRFRKGFGPGPGPDGLGMGGCRMQTDAVSSRIRKVCMWCDVKERQHVTNTADLEGGVKTLLMSESRVGVIVSCPFPPSLSLNHGHWHR